jgi:hypothetical protein
MAYPYETSPDIKVILIEPDTILNALPVTILIVLLLADLYTPNCDDVGEFDNTILVGVGPMLEIVADE